MRVISKDEQERTINCRSCNSKIAYKLEDTYLDFWDTRSIRCPTCKQKNKVSLFDKKLKCKHKHREERNSTREDYHTVEYDIYCEDCGQYLGHWAYGYSDVEENIYFEKWYNRLFYNIKTLISNILDFKIWGFRKHDDSDLPF